VPGWLVEAFYWALSALARGLSRLGVEPDRLTYLSLLLSLSSLPLLATGRFALAALLILAGAALDAIDGSVARAQGRASPAGAVLDSCVDRVADAAPFIGLAVFYRDHAFAMLVPLFALVASSMVSYARAKSEIYRISLPNGLMRRHERVVCLLASLLAAPLWPSSPGLGGVPYPFPLLGTAVIAVLGGVASAVLIARTRAALTAESIAPEVPRATERSAGIEAQQDSPRPSLLTVMRARWSSSKP
jgi:CDP-diacylglycerol--glycerol-3-phosphate 3-phosphatidyltransferase